MVNPNTNVVWGATLKPDSGRPKVELNGIMRTTLKLEISSYIKNFFPVVEWSFTYEYSILDEGVLYIGRDIDLFFLDSERDVLNIFKFTIYSINNLPGSSPSHLGDLFQLTLVPRWVFHQKPSSKAYKASGSQIIQDVFSQELSEYLTRGVVVSSEDSSTTRYRTHQTPNKFIKDRVVPYLRGKDKTSIFCFTTIREEYEIIDVSSMKDASPFIMIDKNSSALPVFTDALNNPEKNKLFLFPFSLTLSVGNVANGGIWPLLDPKLITLSTSQSGQVKTAEIEPKLPNLTNNFDKKFVVVTPSKSNESGMVYLDDSLRRQEDILSNKLHDYSKDLMEAQKFIAPCYFNPYIRIGRLLSLYVSTKDSKELSLYSQLYIISGFKHYFESGRMQTMVELTTTSFSSNKSIQGVSDSLLNF